MKVQNLLTRTVTNKITSQEMPQLYQELQRLYCQGQYPEIVAQLLLAYAPACRILRNGDAQGWVSRDGGPLEDRGNHLGQFNNAAQVLLDLLKNLTWIVEFGLTPDTRDGEPLEMKFQDALESDARDWRWKKPREVIESVEAEVAAINARITGPKHGDELDRAVEWIAGTRCGVRLGTVQAVPTDGCRGKSVGEGHFFALFSSLKEAQQFYNASSLEERVRMLGLDSSHELLNKWWEEEVEGENFSE